MHYELISPLGYEGINIQKILENRGIEKQNIYHFLHTSQEDDLNPLLADNIVEGAKMLARHIANGDKIFLPIDSDCDGFTSAAFFINYLNRLFPSFAQNNIIYKAHTGKEHGIVEKDVPKGIKLVVAIDSSSNDYLQHKHLKEKGIDVLVIDHHEAEKVSENACVINNQLSNYPTKSLSGVGMAYKFCSYIDTLLGTNYAKDYLDLVAVGMIADMMDMRDFETFYLISQGLNNIKNPYIKEMAIKQSSRIGNKVTPIGVGWYISPFINAINRSGTMEEKILVFESMIEYKANQMIPSTKRGCGGQEESLVEQAVRTSINVKNRQERIVKDSLDFLEDVIQEQKLFENKIIPIRVPNNAVDKNLAGLIANKIAGEYHRPTLVLRRIKNNPKLIHKKYSGKSNKRIRIYSNSSKMKSLIWYSWEGSARGYNQSGLDGFKSIISNMPGVIYAEGHQNAFGIGVQENKFDLMLKSINEELRDFDFTDTYKVDVIFQGPHIDGDTILNIADYKEYWGQEINEPYVAIENLRLTKNNIRFLGKDGKTLRIDIPNKKISCIKFFISDEDRENFTITPEQTLVVNIIGRCQKNEYMGNISPEIKLVDYEVVNRLSYCF